MTEYNEIVGPTSSNETAKLTEALKSAQSEYKVVEFDSSNPHFRSKYASFAQCCETLRGPLGKHGLALPDFRPGILGGHWVLVGTLRHVSGEYIQGIAPILNPKGDMQGFGAAVTYAKRTLLMALVGGYVGEADDDSNSTQGTQVQAAAKSAYGIEYEQGAKNAIDQAATKEEAKTILDKIRLRAKEKSVAPDMFRRIEECFNKKWGEKK